MNHSFKRLLTLCFSLLMVFSVGFQGLPAPLPAGPDWRAKVDPWALSAAAQGETEILLLLSEQADLGGAARLQTKTEKGRYVFEQLTQTAERTQPALQRELAQNGLAFRSYWIANMIWARGDLAANQAMQVHGGVGYMQEFNIERHYRDIRVTNIYEGTSQLQVVAALSKLLGHALDPLLDEWAAIDYGAELAPLKSRLVEANGLFKSAIDSLKAHEREIIDFYASDLANMACLLVNAWLLLRDALLAERKRDLAHVYCSEHLPEIHRASEAIQAADVTPLQFRDSVLGSE